MDSYRLRTKSNRPTQARIKGLPDWNMYQSGSLGLCVWERGNHPGHLLATAELSSLLSPDPALGPAFWTLSQSIKKTMQLKGGAFLNQFGTIKNHAI